MQPRDPCMTGERQLSGDLGSAQQLSSHTGKDHVGVHKEGKAFVCIALEVVVKDARSITGGTLSWEMIKFFC